MLRLGERSWWVLWALTWIIPGSLAGQILASPGSETAATVEIVTDDGGVPLYAKATLPIELDVANLQLDWSSSGPEFLSLHVKNEDQPAMAASYSLEAPDTLLLRPAFRLRAGVPYHAVFRPQALARRLGLSTEGLPDKLVADYASAPPAAQPSTRVEAVYPSARVLPENLLKFYLQFSAPMSQGQAYSHVKVLDAHGVEVELALVELEHELWDPEGRRLTLLFDPGRIKSGLKPRREVGPALDRGFDFALVVDPAWLDARGSPLATGHRKNFRVGEPDHASPDPEQWQWSLPRRGSRDPLRLDFGEPLDHALLNRLLWIVDGQGHRLEGVLEISEHETRWSFRPEQPWQGDSYELRVDHWLEDVAGNRLTRPFEVDLEAPPEPRTATGEPERPFWSRRFEPVSP